MKLFIDTCLRTKIHIQFDFSGTNSGARIVQVLMQFRTEYACAGADKNPNMFAPSIIEKTVCQKLQKTSSTPDLRNERTSSPAERNSLKTVHEGYIDAICSVRRVKLSACPTSYRRLWPKGTHLAVALVQKLIS
jgi:hypothetical protein